MTAAIKEAHAAQLEDLATKRDLKELEYRMTIRTGLMLVTVAGMLFTALRYFPPTQPIVLSSHQIPGLEQGLGKSPGSGQ